MRHNQNARRPRGRNGGGSHHSGGHSNNGGGNSHHSIGGQQGGRRVNPRVQNFDSNGPDVRIRGTAYQINEKYVTLARDATSAGDRVLAESYLQHAEHYQRFINEMTEEFNQYNLQNPQQQPQPQQPQQMQQQQASMDGNMQSPPADGLNDLDQGFLVGPRHGAQPNGNGGADGQQQSADAGENSQQLSGDQNRSRHAGRQHSPRRNDSETA